MDWFAAVDSYCERTGPDYWSEPVNALTNLAFLIAALVMWLRLERVGGRITPTGAAAEAPRGRAMARALCLVLALIGIGSWLFHTHANRLTGLMDVLPILGFILLYVFAASRDLIGLRWYLALALTAGFIPYAAATVPLFGMLGFLGSSAAYAPVPLLILIYAAVLRRRAPRTARGLAIGAVILIVSLTFRTLDGPLCDRLPLGTHFMWHILNAVMLGWMIEVYRRHMLAAPPRRR